MHLDAWRAWLRRREPIRCARNNAVSRDSSPSLLCAGIDSVFISGGIHASDLGVSGGAEPAPEALANVVAKEGGYVPTFAVGVFRW